jgi:hypothetical protein
MTSSYTKKREHVMANRPVFRPGTPVDPSLIKAASEDDAMTFIPSIPNTDKIISQNVKPPVKPIEEKKVEKIEKIDNDAITRLTPAERWEAGLKDAKLSKESAYEIIRAILRKGYWEKEYSIWNGELTATFRTRDRYHVHRVRRALEALADRTEFAISQAVFSCNLAGSLMAFQGKELPHPELGTPRVAVEEAYKIRYDFVDALQAPVTDQLTVALAHFDALVAAATQEGAAQGF